MSNVDPSSASAPPKKTTGLAKSIVFGTLGVLAIIAGLTKMSRGLSELFGWGDSATISKLIEESDAAAGEGIKHSEAGDAKLNELIQALNSSDLDAVRRDHRDAIESASTELAAAAERIELARSKLEEVLKLGVTTEARTFLETRALSFASYVEAYGARRDAVKLLQAETITDEGEFLAKFNQLIDAAGQAITKANDLTAKANELAERKS